ncbi:hypothetical protein EV401DRAFT_1982592 [Pisolithus croceorrhizus]|nr:hypothetical protein EV401DRAFT_1982592 [Pisolithus croceorrhizus]
MHAQHDLPTPDGYGIIKRPSSDIFHRLYDDHTTPVGLLYKALNVTEVEGRKLSSRVRSVIVQSDFDLGKKLLDHTSREMRKLEQLVLEEVPGFQRYEDCWPISVLVRRHLRHRTALKSIGIFSGTPTRCEFFFVLLLFHELFLTQIVQSREKIMDKKPGPLFSAKDGMTAMVHPARMNQRPERCSQSRKDSELAPAEDLQACQEHYELRDFLDEHGKTHLLFALIRSGITGDPEFSSFIDMPPAVRRAFLTAALDTSAYEVDALQVAAMQYNVIRQ